MGQAHVFAILPSEFGERIMTKAPESVPLPLTVVMITLNEAHNMDAVCENLRGFARDIVVLDSFSKDDTVGIALRHGARVYQRKFTNFGDQWNTAILRLPISTPWVMKLDPDERLTPAQRRENKVANRPENSKRRPHEPAALINPVVAGIARE